MKIALMTNNYKPIMGGVPISIERLARGLESMGHQVTIFAPTYQEQQQEENVFRYATCMKHFIGGIVLPNPFDRRIEKEFRKQEYDLIHVHHPMLIGRTAVYLSRKYRIPLVFTYHTRYEQYLSYVGAVKLLENQASKEKGIGVNACAGILHLIKDKLMPAYLHTFLKYCDFVFAPTAGIREYLERVCGIAPEKLGILPTGIERANFQVTEQETRRIRERFGSSGLPLFLTVSRMSHEKNVEFLIESLRRLKYSYGKNFRMVFVGDGPDRKTYEAECKKAGLEENVFFTGIVPNEEIPPYFAAADAFLFASKTETQGIVILEALAGASPVIAVSASGVSDLVTPKCGILTREDPEEFAKSTADFIDRRMGRAGMEENALQTAQQYREEAVAFRAVHYYNKVIAGKAVLQEAVSTRARLGQ